MEWSELRDEVRSVWDDNAAFWDNHVGEEGNVFARTLVYPTAERQLALQPGWRVLELPAPTATLPAGSRRRSARCWRPTSARR